MDKLELEFDVKIRELMLKYESYRKSQRIKEGIRQSKLKKREENMRNS